MVKLVGAVLILSASCYLPVSHMVRIRAEVHQSQLLETTFRSFRRKLDHSGISMSELLIDGKRQVGETGLFFAGLHLSALMEHSFQDMWESALAASRFSSEIRNCLRPLGAVLGQYDREAQCEGLLATEEALRRHANGLQDTLEHDRRMWFTLSLSSGMILIMMIL